jgi:putative lysine decarboxylase
MDECFELLTLMQTGKSMIVPVVLVETGPTPYWRTWDRFVQGTVVERRLIEAEDTAFYRIVDAAEDAVREIHDFYRVYHSSRIVADNLVLRLNRGLTDDEVAEVQQRFEDILKGPLVQAPGPIPQELNEYPELPRLIVPFNRSSYSRLRRLIDALNERGDGGRADAARTAPEEPSALTPDPDPAP